MHRAFCFAASLVILAGCQVPPEPLPVQPVPDNGKVLEYTEVVNRARLQATAANEAFYVDKWKELEDAAGALELTAGYLAKASKVPDKQREKLASNATDLSKQATELREAAKAQDVKRVNDLLQRIHLKVRELRPEN
jgi:hypothetical protein